MNRMPLSIIRPTTLALAAAGWLALAPAALAAERPGLAEAVGQARQLLLDLRDGLARPLPEPRLAELADEGAGEAQLAEAQNLPKPRIIGTWNVHVPGPDPSQDFDALQTFHADGTFTETSSLLGSLVEGPAHGVWVQTKNGFVLTFELFAFDEQGTPTGRIRVRNRIFLEGGHSFRAVSTVDVLPPDGEPILDVGGGEYTATRLQPLAP
ncbi:MAG TPA: hypothetical protein VF017_10230 [Thermoanaerobaculia bacterium]|nr:hypothetical protein [Thermoanaerobaculia bacterium]